MAADFNPFMTEGAMQPQQNPFLVPEADICEGCAAVGEELRRQLVRTGAHDEELTETLVAKARCSEHGGLSVPQTQEVEPVRPGRKKRPNGDYYSLDPSVRAQQLIEDGKIGPQFAHLGGARRKRDKRAAQVVTEAAAENAERIKKVLLDGISEEMPYSVRLKAALELLGVEERFAKEQARQEQAEIDAMSKAELAGEIMTLIQSIQRAGQIAREVEEMTGGEVIEAEIIE